MTYFGKTILLTALMSLFLASATSPVYASDDYKCTLKALQRTVTVVDTDTGKNKISIAKGRADVGKMVKDLKVQLFRGNVQQMLTKANTLNSALGYPSYSSCEDGVEEEYEDLLLSICDQECGLQLARFFLFMAADFKYLNSKDPELDTTDHAKIDENALKNARYARVIVERALKSLMKHQGGIKEGDEEKTDTNSGFAAYVRNLAQLNATRIRILMTTGDIYYRQASELMLEGYANRIQDQFNENPGIKNESLKKAYLYYELAQWNMIDAKTNIPNNPLFADLQSVLIGLSGDIQTRIDSVENGYLYLGIDPHAISTLSAKELIEKLKTTTAQLNNIETKVNELLEKGQDSFMLLKNNELQDQNWKKNQEINLKVHKLGKLGHIAKTLKDETAAKLNQLQLESLDIDGKIQDSKIKRDQFNSKMVVAGSIMNQLHGELQEKGDLTQSQVQALKNQITAMQMEQETLAGNHEATLNEIDAETSELQVKLNGLVGDKEEQINAIKTYITKRKHKLAVDVKKQLDQINLVQEEITKVKDVLDNQLYEENEKINLMKKEINEFNEIINKNQLLADAEINSIKKALNALQKQINGYEVEKALKNQEIAKVKDAIHKIKHSEINTKEQIEMFGYQSKIESLKIDLAIKLKELEFKKNSIAKRTEKDLLVHAKDKAKADQARYRWLISLEVTQLNLTIQEANLAMEDGNLESQYMAYETKAKSIRNSYNAKTAEFDLSKKRVNDQEKNLLSLINSKLRQYALNRLRLRGQICEIEAKFKHLGAKNPPKFEGINNPTVQPLDALGFTSVQLVAMDLNPPTTDVNFDDCGNEQNKLSLDTEFFEPLPLFEISAENPVEGIIANYEIPQDIQDLLNAANKGCNLEGLTDYIAKNHKLLCDDQNGYKFQMLDIDENALALKSCLVAEQQGPECAEFNLGHNEYELAKEVYNQNLKLIENEKEYITAQIEGQKRLLNSLEAIFNEQKTNAHIAFALAQAKQIAAASVSAIPESMIITGTHAGAWAGTGGGASTGVLMGTAVSATSTAKDLAQTALIWADAVLNHKMTIDSYRHNFTTSKEGIKTQIANLKKQLESYDAGNPRLALQEAAFQQTKLQLLSRHKTNESERNKLLINRQIVDVHCDSEEQNFTTQIESFKNSHAQLVIDLQMMVNDLSSFDRELRSIRLAVAEELKNQQVMSMDVVSMNNELANLAYQAAITVRNRNVVEVKKCQVAKTKNQVKELADKEEKSTELVDRLNDDYEKMIFALSQDEIDHVKSMIESEKDKTTALTDSLEGVLEHVSEKFNMKRLAWEHEGQILALESEIKELDTLISQTEGEITDQKGILVDTQHAAETLEKKTKAEIVVRETKISDTIIQMAEIEKLSTDQIKLKQKEAEHLRNALTALKNNAAIDESLKNNELQEMIEEITKKENELKTQVAEKNAQIAKEKIKFTEMNNTIKTAMGKQQKAIGELKQSMAAARVALNTQANKKRAEIDQLKIAKHDTKELISKMEKEKIEVARDQNRTLRDADRIQANLNAQMKKLHQDIVEQNKKVLESDNKKQNYIWLESQSLLSSLIKGIPDYIKMKKQYLEHANRLLNLLRIRYEKLASLGMIKTDRLKLYELDKIIGTVTQGSVLDKRITKYEMKLSDFNQINFMPVTDIDIPEDSGLVRELLANGYASFEVNPSTGGSKDNMEAVGYFSIWHEDFSDRFNGARLVDVLPVVDNTICPNPAHISIRHTGEGFMHHKTGSSDIFTELISLQTMPFIPRILYNENKTNHGNTIEDWLAAGLGMKSTSLYGFAESTNTFNNRAGSPLNTEFFGYPLIGRYEISLEPACRSDADSSDSGQKFKDFKGGLKLKYRIVNNDIPRL